MTDTKSAVTEDHMQFDGHGHATTGEPERTPEGHRQLSPLAVALALVFVFVVWLVAARLIWLILPRASLYQNRAFYPSIARSPVCTT